MIDHCWFNLFLSNEVESLFIYLLDIGVSSSINFLSLDFAHFSIGFPEIVLPPPFGSRDFSRYHCQPRFRDGLIIYKVVKRVDDAY